MISVKLLGILDILAAITFWIFAIFGFLPSSLILIFGLILFVKGLFFITSFSFVTVLDIICAIVIISSTSITIPKIIVIIVSLFLLQKGVFSLLG